MAHDDKGRSLHGRLEFFDRNVTQLTKHVEKIVGHHQGESAQETVAMYESEAVTKHIQMPITACRRLIGDPPGTFAL